MRFSQQIQNNDVFTFNVSGHLGGPQVGEAETYLTQMVTDHRPKGMILNMAEVPWMDSSGLSFLVRVNKTLKELNVNFAVCSLNEENLNVIRLTRLNRILKVYTSAEDAYAKLIN